MKVNVIQYERQGIPYDPVVIAQGNNELLLQALALKLSGNCEFRLPYKDETAEQYYEAFNNVWDNCEPLDEQTVKANMLNGHRPDSDDYVRWWDINLNEVPAGVEQ